MSLQTSLNVVLKQVRSKNCRLPAPPSICLVLGSNWRAGLHHVRGSDVTSDIQARITGSPSFIVIALHFLVFAVRMESIVSPRK